MLPEAVKLWGRSASCDLVCWHFARILHKLTRFMGQPLRLDSLEKGMGREAGAGGNDSSWNMIQQIDNKLASLATHFLRSVRRAETHPEKLPQAAPAGSLPCSIYFSLCLHLPFSRCCQVSLLSRSLADYARTHFEVEKSMEYAKYSLGYLSSLCLNVAGQKMESA